MSKMSTRTREKPYKSMGHHEKYISRITKTLYYGKLPKADCLSFPVTELAAELFSESQRGRSLDRLHCDDAVKISRNARVSPCSFVLALLYLERLKMRNKEYLEKTSPSDLFLVSLMVSSKFLYDDGETDEVFMDDWSSSAGKTNKQLVQLEKDFLKAISWEIYINEPTFWKKLNDIEMVLAMKQGGTRGFFTYTELELLLKTIDLTHIVQCMFAVSVILAASYVVAIISMLGSIFIVNNLQKSCTIKEIETVPDFHNATLNTLPEKQLNLNETFLKKESGALNILQTGLFLASIEFMKPYSYENHNETDNNVQCVTWDWWNVPTMDWLSKSSEMMDTYIQLPRINLDYYTLFMEIFAANIKHLELEDQIHKATKTRIQDQIEGSWHEEWEDTIDLRIVYGQNVKS